MEPVTLRPITQENFNAVIQLKVRDDQAGFVASNAYSLAEAGTFPGRTPLAVYAGETPVGFVMYCDWTKRGEYWIFRLMVAADQQGKGYGREAMRLLIERMREEFHCRSIFISFEPDNAAAEGLYRSLGFLPTGEMVENETVYRLDFPEEG